MAEKEDEEWDGNSHQIYHSTWCQTRGIPAARHLGYNIFDDHLTYAHSHHICPFYISYMPI